MNYVHHYESLMQKAKNRDSKFLSYTETHHIVPKSENGTDEDSNLVELTAREHFLAHWLLYRANPEIKSRAFSFWRMCNGRGSCPIEEWPVISSRAYEEARQAHSDSISKLLTGVKKTNEHIEKVRAKVTGQKRTEEQKQKLRKPHNVTEEGRQISRNNLQKAIEKCKKRVIMIDKDTLDDILEFGSLKEAADYVGLKSSNIRVALREGSLSGNYRWKYKEQLEYVKKPDNRENSRQNFLGDRNPNKSEEARKRISERFTGSNNPRSVKVNQYTLNGDFIRSWDCMASAAKNSRVNSTNIQKCCAGKRNQTGGYKWSYA